MKILNDFISNLTDLQKRILFTVGALVIYRIGSFIPLPGVNAAAILHFFEGDMGMLGMMDMFAGGSLSRMSVLALNIFPYISASIVIQLLTATTKSLSDLRKEGETGRIKINQYTRYLAVALAIVQGFAVVRGLSMMSSGGIPAVANPGFMFELTAVIALVGGTVFVMWMAEQITARGLGQGASLLIMAGIIAEVPGGIARMANLGAVGQISPAMILLIVGFVVGLFALIAFFEQAQRRIQILYPRAAVGNGGAQNANASYLPIKVNMSGVMGPVFAMSIMMLPSFIHRFVQSENVIVQNIMGALAYGTWTYMIMFSVLIVFFAFFQTSVIFNSQDTSNNLKNAGGYIPGVRPGETTMKYLDEIVSRTTVIGAAYLVVVCTLPILLNTQFGMPLAIGGTSVLIVANVVMDTYTQIQSHLSAKQYGAAMTRGGTGRFRA